MGHRQRQCIRCIGRGRTAQREERPDHEGHLPLVGLPVPRDRPFDPSRRIFEDRDIRPREVQQDDPTSVPQLRRSLRVLMEEEGLDRADVRLELIQDVDQRPIDVGQPLRERRLRPRPDDAVRNVFQPVTDRSHDPPAEQARPGIDAQRDHDPPTSKDRSEWKVRGERCLFLQAKPSRKKVE